MGGGFLGVPSGRHHAKFRIEVAKQKEARHTKKRQAMSNTLIKHLKALVEAQRKKKAGPSALDSVMEVLTRDLYSCCSCWR